MLLHLVSLECGFVWFHYLIVTEIAEREQGVSMAMVENISVFSSKSA
jgi:hypothetical protein